VRNRYLDLLRAVAIVRVIVYHHFGWPLLSIVFPAMGVMFAVAGSLTAASLAKRSPGSVVTSRMRRLLPPVWLLGLVAVPAMLYAGWQTEPDGQHPFSLPSLAYWLLPLGDPPGSDAGAFVWDALWYVRTYLWLVLLSPLLYPVFKKVGWPLLAVPLLLMVVLERGSFGMPASVESALWDLSTYGACWLAGFAHRDGRLGRTHPVVAVGAFAALAGTGLYWLVQGHAETGWDLNEVSEAQAVYSLAFVLIALRWQPPIERIVTNPKVDRFINLLNARAVTVYLWHGAAIASVYPLLERTNMEDLGKFEAPITLGITFTVTALAVVVFGWAEDLAAKRRPRLWPADETPRPAPEPEPLGPVPSGWPEEPRTEPQEPAPDLVTPGLRLAPGPAQAHHPEPGPHSSAAPNAFHTEPGPHSSAAPHALHPETGRRHSTATQALQPEHGSHNEAAGTAHLSAPGLRLSTTDTSPNLRLAHPDAVPPQYYGPRLASAAGAPHPPARPGHTPSSPGDDQALYNQAPHDRTSYDRALADQASSGQAGYDQAPYVPTAYEPAAYDQARYEPSAHEPSPYEPTAHEPTAHDQAPYEPAASDRAAHDSAGAHAYSYDSGPGDMPVAGRPAQGYHRDESAPNGYSGVPWAGHTADSPRDLWQPTAQRTANAPDDAPALRYDGTP
jgi:hypothetical protein